MEDAVSLDQLQGLGERLAAMQAVLGSGVAMPLDVEAVRVIAPVMMRSLGEGGHHQFASGPLRP